MEPVTLIAAALAAGAAAGGQDAAQSAVKDAYTALRDRLTRARSERPGEPPSEEPESIADVATVLRRADPAVVDGLLLDSDRLIGALHHEVRVRVDDSRGVIVGDHATQTNHFAG